MESNTNEDSKSSSEETDRSSSEREMGMGIGRSYECVFCKRGFTTAQALGGHMNIHRKDRAKNSTTSSRPIASISDENNSYPSFRSYNMAVPVLQSYPTSTTHYAVAASEVHINSYQTFFPESTWSDQRALHNNQLQRDLRDWRSGNLGLRVGTTPFDDNGKRQLGRGVSGDDDDELDLELRLGHDP